MPRLLATGLIILLVFACEERKWTNIYDPDNTVDPAEWAPENFGITQVSDTKVRLSWEQRDPRIEGLMIDRRKGNGDWDIEYAVLDSSLRSWVDTVSFDGTDYHYRIYNYAGVSRSTTLESDISLEFPAVQNLTITHNSETSVTLSWSQHVFTEFDHYLIERKTGAGSFEALDSVASNITQYTDKPLSTDSSYSYRVFAVTESNRSEPGIALSIAWTTTTYSEVWSGNHQGSVNRVLFSHDGSFLVSAGNDSAVKVWNAASGAELWSDTHAHMIKSIDISYDDSRVAAAGGTYNAGEFSCWTISGSQLWTKQASSVVNDIKFSPDGNTLVTGSNSAYVKLWNVADGYEQWSVDLPDQVWNVHFHPQGLYIAAGGWYNGVKVLNISDGSQYKAYSGSPYTQQVYDLAFSSDDSRLATVGSDWFIQCWDLDNGFVWKDQHEGIVNCVDYRPDDEYIVSGGNDYLVRMWKASDGTAVWQGSHTSNVVDVQFSPDGSKVVSASYDNTIKVWDALSGSLLWTGELSGPVNTVDFGIDESQMSSGNNMGIVQVWEGQKTWYVISGE